MLHQLQWVRLHLAHFDDFYDIIEQQDKSFDKPIFCICAVDMNSFESTTGWKKKPLTIRGEEKISPFYIWKGKLTHTRI